MGRKELTWSEAWGAPPGDPFPPRNLHGAAVQPGSEAAGDCPRGGVFQEGVAEGQRDKEVSEEKDSTCRFDTLTVYFKKNS